MKEWPRGEDEARVARSGGSGASGCRDWARAGRGGKMLGSDVSKAKIPLGGASRTRCCRSATERTHQRNQFAKFRGIPWKRQQGKFQLQRYPGTGI